jgi:hypothetical protein
MVNNLFFKNNNKKTFNYLEMTPYCMHKHVIKDNGLVDVLVPKFTNKFAVKYLIPRSKSPFIRANLDEFGSTTWLLMDGKNNVSEISDKLIEKFGETIQPVNARLTLFLTNLYNNQFISFNELIKGSNNG